MNKDWTSKEVKLIVEDYFDMLLCELNHIKYNKSAHRRKLLPLLDGRTNGSVEFKHRNITAALMKMGLPYINGYVPSNNYQKKLLEKEIAEYIKAHKPALEMKFETFAVDVGVIQKIRPVNYDKIIEAAPEPSEMNEDEPLFRPVKTNFLEKEQNNRTLGELGEQFVLDFEKSRLIKAGKIKFAEKIEWVSKEKGDGLGYDILSKNTNGTDRYIEVKTTKLSKNTPIFLTKNELSFSRKNSTDFFLYRVFNFEKRPKLFILNGEYDSFCRLQPQVYKGFF